MQKTKQIIHSHQKKLNFDKEIMSKVNSGQITMKSKWYFMIGSLMSVVGLISLSIGAIFLTNLTIFLLKKHGPMGQVRLEAMLNSIPLWIPILAIVGIVLGIVALRRYDFSYKKNFSIIVIVFVLSIIAAGFVIDYLGINDTWGKRGPMQGLYQQIDKQSITNQPNSGGKQLQNGKGSGSGQTNRKQNGIK